MKLSMEQAAQIIGKTKKTIYNHKDRNRFSYEIDDEGKAVIDVSELLRVYGSTPEITQRLDSLQKGEGSENTQTYTPSKPAKKAQQEENFEFQIQIVKLEAELEKEKALKRKIEDEADYFKSALEESQKTAQKVTMLLEDKTSERGGEWEKALKALENRLANQEKTSKDREERERKLVDENRRIKQAYINRKKALAAEQSKSFWQKLFG